MIENNFRLYCRMMSKVSTWKTSKEYNEFGIVESCTMNWLRNQLSVLYSDNITNYVNGFIKFCIFIIPRSEPFAWLCSSSIDKENVINLVQFCLKKLTVSSYSMWKFCRHFFFSAHSICNVVHAHGLILFAQLPNKMSNLF